MFAKILHRQALAIVISLIILFLGGLAVKNGASVAAENGTSLRWVTEGSRDALVCGFHAFQNFLFNFANVSVLPEIKRIQGVARPTILGNRAYTMRIELNRERMRAYKVSAEEVMKAVAEQSMIGSPGRLGQATGITSQTIEYVLTWVIVLRSLLESRWQTCGRHRAQANSGFQRDRGHQKGQREAR